MARPGGTLSALPKTGDIEPAVDVGATGRLPGEAAVVEMASGGGLERCPVNSR